MPQKKNADSLELIRSKAGRVFGRVRTHTDSSAVESPVSLLILTPFLACLYLPENQKSLNQTLIHSH